MLVARWVCVGYLVGWLVCVVLLCEGVCMCWFCNVCVYVLIL